MSTEVEQRVLQMKFDNAKFEAGVKTTMFTLDKLKSSLKFDGIAKGFNNITSAAKSVDLSAMGASAEAVSVKFSALQVFAMTAFSRISNSAITTGKNIVKAFTIDPVKMGFQEYETQMNAVQTILANTSNKGSTIDDVNRALAELNTYADKTIYNFTEMTRNIGTFTAAGIELDTSVSAIKGIANLAAVSGSNAQQASTAMYQLSQALAAGRVSLQDWNSVVNAGMGGEIFQEELKRTSRVMGTGVDEAIAKYGTFRESLTQGAWLTTEVLTETLQKFTGDMNKESLLAKGYTEAQAEEILKLGDMANDAATKVKTFSQLMDTLKEAAQSGWTVTWQTIVGDFEEAKVLFTSISETLGGIIGRSADARNNMLIGWKELGGRDDLIKGFANIWESMYGIISKVGEAFREVFPRTTSEELKGLTGTFLKLTEALKPSENTLNAVKMAFKGLFSVVKLFTSVLTIPLKFIPILVDLFSALGSIVTKVAGFFGTLTSGLFGFVSAGDVVNNIFDKLVGVLAIASGAILDFVTNFNMPLSIDAMKEAVPAFGTICDAADTAKEAFLKYGEQVIKTFQEVDKQALAEKVSGALQKTVDFVFNIYDNLKSRVSDLLSFGADMLSTAMNNMKKFIEWVDWKQVFEFFTGAVAAKFFLTLASVMKKLSGAFETVAKNTSFLKDIGESITGVLDSVQDSLKSWQNSLRASNLLKIGAAIGLIATSVLILSKIDVDKLIPAMAALGGIFVGLTASSIAIAKFAEGGALKGLMGMGTAIYILASAVSKLADIDPVKMTIALAGVMALITSLGAYSIIMSKMKAQITSGALVLMAFATAILILTSAVLKLTNIDAGKLAIAMSGIVALSMSVALSSKILGKGDDGKGSLKLMAFASSIKTLAKATKILSEIPFTSMIKGIGGLGLIMLELGIFSRLVDNTKMISTAIGMNILAVALTAMIVPLNILGRMKVDTFVTGMSMMATTIVGLGLSLKTMPNNLPAIGFGLNLVSSALIVMSGAIAIVGNLEWETLIKAIFGFGVSLAGLAVALNAMVGTLGGSAALVVASSAMVIFAGAIGLMGSLSLGTIALGIVGFAGGLAVLTVAAFALAPVAPVLLGMSGALIAFTASLAIGAAAIAIFGAGLVSIAAGLTAMVGLGMAWIKMMEAAIMSLAGLVPVIGKAAADLVVAFIEGLSRGKNAIRRAMVDLILVSLEAINDVVPAFVETVLNVIDKVFVSLAKHAEPIIKNMVKFLIGVIRGISTHLPELISEGVLLIKNLFVGIADAVSQLSMADLGKMVAGAAIMAGIVAIASAILPLIPTAMLAMAGLGAVVMEMIGILALIGGIAQIPGLNWLVTEGGDLLMQVGKAIGKFAGGIVSGIAEGIMSTLPKFGQYLSEFMTNAKPFFDGMNNVDDSLITSVAALAGAVALLTATSFLDGIVRFFNGGKSTLVEFGKQLASFAPYYKSYAVTMAGTNGDELVKTSNAVKAIGEFVKMIPSQSGLSKLLLGERDLVGFGKTLMEFAPYFKAYANTISGINSESVIASSAAATSIAEFADKIPNTGGLAAIFAGDNTLAKWGKELAAFGPYFAMYSASVTGVNASVVANSVSAATALSEFATKIPNKGGLVALFTGDNSLSSLAKDMAKFGPELKNYSDSVVGVSVTNITNSVRGASELVGLAKVIPQGKLRLSVLGDELSDFGKSLGKYYERTSNINASTLTSTISAINKLVDMCKNIESVNTYSLETFSEGLSRLGVSGVNDFINAFSGSHDKAKTAVSGFIQAAISSVNSSSVGVSTAANEMMNTIMSSITLKGPSITSAMTTLFQALGTVVQNGSIGIRQSMISMVDILTLTITSKTPAVASAMTLLMGQILATVQGSAGTMYSAGNILVSNLSVGISTASGYAITAMTRVVSSALSSVRSYDGTFRSAGTTLISNLTSGINSAANNATTSISRMLSTMRNSINSYGSVFRSAGLNLSQNLASGVSAGSYQVTSAGKKVANDAAYAVKGYYWTWYSSGGYLVEGFAQGITDNTYIATARARNMARAADTAARNQLEINSPSRVGDEIGMYFVKGFAGGIEKNMKESTDQSATMADKAKTALEDTLSNMAAMMDMDMDYSPTITPVLDLSNVEKGGRTLSSILTANMAAEASYGMTRRLSSHVGTEGSNYNNTEYNITNEFNITARPQDDPTSVANEVSRIIQLQVERRDAVWE